MAGQTYSPYRRNGRPPQRAAGNGRTSAPRRSGLSLAMLSPEPPEAAPVRRTLPTGGLNASSLADPAARRWVVLGALGIVSSILLTIAMALLGSRSVASADQPPAEPARANRVTLIREIGGVPKSPTPGTGITASAPAAPGSSAPAPAIAQGNGPNGSNSLASAALRQLRRVGRAMVTPDGIRRLALGGSLPFADGSTVSAFLQGHSTPQVAAADTNDPDVTLIAGATFLRIDGAADSLRNSLALVGRNDITVLASPTARIVSQATTVPTVMPTAIPTPQPIPTAQATATATTVPPTQTPVVVTATPLPPTQTPVVVTATPEPTRRPTRTPTPEIEVIVVTATPVPGQYPNGSIPFVPPGMIPWLTGAATSTPVVAPTFPAPPTAIPTNTALPTATPNIAVAQSAPAAAPAPRQAQTQAQTQPTEPAGPAPILAETGTRTPVNTPTPRTAPRQAPQTEGQPAQSGAPSPQAVAAAPQDDPARDPALMERLAARALLAVNAARTQAGALPLARNAALDTAAAVHAQYDVATGQTEGNFQTRGTPLFLGETPSARAARAAGSRGPGSERVAEVMALGEAEPERAVQGWLDSVFHRVLLLDLAAHHAGYGQHTVGAATTSVLDLGGRRDVANASGWFPASGATDVPTRCICDDYAEAADRPGPFGYPATLLLGQVRPQGMPTLATLTEGSESGAAVAADLVDAYGNPTLLPQSPLKAGTKYVVQMSWTNGPSVTWSFTTGN